MERKIIKNQTAPHKKYLINLIHIFTQIQDELKKIPQFDCQNLIDLKGIHEDCIKKTPPQRQIKKENEIKLFKQTFQQICLINKRKPKGRKSELVMKFTMVSNILIQRMKESLCIKGDTKELLIQNISKLKDSFMAWGQSSINFQKFSYCSQTKTNGNNMKYIFSQLTTTNASAYNSRDVSKCAQKDPKDNRLGEDDNQESNLNDNSFKLNPKLLKRRQRHTVNFNELNSFKKRNKAKRTSKYVKRAQQKNLQAQETILQHSINSKQKNEQIQRKPRKKTNFFDKSLNTNHKNMNYQHGRNHHQKASSNQLISEQNQLKKSAYYMSQNYIRSRKNIQNITLFVNVNRTKKQIGNLFLNMDATNQKSFDGQIFIERTSGFKSTKLLTKKFLPQEDEVKPKIPEMTSEKNIPRKPSAFINKGGNTHTGGFYEKKPMSKFYKNVQEDIQEIKLEKPPQFLKKHFTSIKQENGIELIESRVNPQPIVEGKNISQFYSELGQMRSEFQKHLDPYYHNRSIFFQQQTSIWDEEKRRLQRVLQQRGRHLWCRQFKMQFYASHRQQQQALKGIRSDIFNCHQTHSKAYTTSALDQMDLNKPTI